MLEGFGGQWRTLPVKLPQKAGFQAGLLLGDLLLCFGGWAERVRRDCGGLLVMAAMACFTTLTRQHKRLCSGWLAEEWNLLISDARICGGNGERGTKCLAKRVHQRSIML